MRLCQKLVVLFGILFLFFISKNESNSELLPNFLDQEKTSYHQITENNSQIILFDKLNFPLENSRLDAPKLVFIIVSVDEKKLANEFSKVASKSFLSKTINRISCVSPLLFPVHYFW